mgnify:CR=1 FL=1
MREKSPKKSAKDEKSARSPAKEMPASGASSSDATKRGLSTPKWSAQKGRAGARPPTDTRSARRKEPKMRRYCEICEKAHL